MKNFISSAILISLLSIASSVSAADILWDQFVSPPDSCRTKLWWFHGETVTTKEGIDADLKAFSDKGIGGVVFYDQVHGKAQGAAESMSDEWWEMLKYAALKAKHYGLTFEIAASNGYVAGGPWITPELSMKKTTFTDTLITMESEGVINLDLSVADPHFRDIATVIFPDEPVYNPLRPFSEPITVRSNDTIINLSTNIDLSPEKQIALRGITYSVTPRGKGSTGSMNIPGKPQPRYFGAKYKEYPPLGQLEYSTDGRSWHKAADLLPIESNIGHKSRVRSISFPAVKADHLRLHFHNWNGNDSAYRSFTISDIALHTRDITDNPEVKSGLRTEVTYPSVVGGETGVIDPASVSDISRHIDSTGRLELPVGKGTWRIIRFGYVPTGAKTKHGRKNLLGREADVMSAQAANIHYGHYFKAILDTLSAIGCKPAGLCMDSHEAGIQNWTEGFEQNFRTVCGYDILPWIPTFAGYIVGSRNDTDRVLSDFRRTVASTIADNFYGTFAARCMEDSVDYTSQAMLNILTDNIADRGKSSKPQGEFWEYQTNGNYDCLDAASSAHLYGRNIASAEAFTDTPYSTSWDKLLRIANIAYCRGINEFVVCASSYQPWMDRKYDDSSSSHPYVFHRHHPDWDRSGHFWNYQARCAGMLRIGIPVVDLCIYLGDDPPLKTMSYKLPEIPEGYNFDVCTADALLNRMSVTDGVIKVSGGMEYKALIIQDRSYISPEAEKQIAALQESGAVVIRCDKGEDVADCLGHERIIPDVSLSSAGLPDDRTLFFHRRTDDGDIYFIYNHSDHETDHRIAFRNPYVKAERWNPADISRDNIAPDGDGKLPLTLKPYESTFVITR